MGIAYDEDRRDLPSDQLLRLFALAGWVHDGPNDLKKNKFFNMPFINSTLVVSAWEGERLVGAVRVLSDKIIRATIYDLVVDPEYQGRGIGRELVRRCLARYPDAEWLIETEEHIAGFYEKLGFKRYGEVILTIPSKYQSQ